MKKLKNNIGMTLAEMLIVVAIIGVLGGVAFIAVWNYQRSLGQLERDGIAKEIFVAAQNHLTVAYGEGYLGVTEFGEPGTASEDTGKEVYYFTVNGSILENSVLGQMLPFGSVDETVRAGGSYIVRYQKDTGLVLDVFYCTRSGSPTSFNHDLAYGEYEDVLALKDTETANHKQDRRNWNEHILGWYGGTEAESLPKATLQPPAITVHNEEKLYVEITNPNTGVTDSNGNSVTVSIRLLIKGLSSGTEHYVNVSDVSQPVVLDDITSSSNSEGHFAYRRFDDMTNQLDNGFIPGENIEIQAVAFSTGTLANTAYSSKATTNSLFGSIANLLDTTGAAISASSTDKVLETAYIGNIRHLENLDAYVSNLGMQTTNDRFEQFSITAAKQTTDFSWNTFKEKTNQDSTTVYYSSTKGDDFSPITSTAAQSYYPIEPDYALTYDGQRHSISDIMVNIAGDAGLFGATSLVTEIKDLELIDFNITSTSGNAGALVGTVTGTEINNVLAYNKTLTGLDPTVTGTGSVGGLIGSATNCTVEDCAAALVVGKKTITDTDGEKTITPTNAGGLIGTSSGGEVKSSYSGGHTKEAKYYDGSTPIYNVTASGKAGGLIGDAGNTGISNSYSTCSATGANAGGFVGSASGEISNCYCTGLVRGTTTEGAFAASLGGTATSCLYYEIINERPDSENGYLNALGIDKTGTDISGIDANVESYNKFVGGESTWYPANPYDSQLRDFYNGKYPLRTVSQIAADNKVKNEAETGIGATHYGDWPSPEIFVINTQ